MSPTRLRPPAKPFSVSNFGPTHGTRDVWSIYWEVRLPVTSSAWNVPGLYSLELDYQERFENFSDFGATERPKFSEPALATGRRWVDERESECAA